MIESFTGTAVGLHDEDVGTPDRRVEAAVDLAVGELAEIGLTELDAQLPCDLAGEFGMGTAGHQHQSPAWGEFHGQDATAPLRSASCDDGPDHRTRSDLGPLGEHREGPHPCVGTDRRTAADARLDHRALADRGVDEA